LLGNCQILILPLLATELGSRSVVLDGEIMCVDAERNPNSQTYYFGEGSFGCGLMARTSVTCLSSRERPGCVRSCTESVNVCSLATTLKLGESLFRLACENELEGIDAKRKYDPYIQNHVSWLKIRNQEYAQRADFVLKNFCLQPQWNTPERSQLELRFPLPEKRSSQNVAGNLVLCQ
jgi:ATP-dependent DNA ligase